MDGAHNSGSQNEGSQVELRFEPVPNARGLTVNVNLDPEDAEVTTLTQASVDTISLGATQANANSVAAEAVSPTMPRNDSDILPRNSSDSPTGGDRFTAFSSALKLIREGLWIGDLGCMISKEWQKQDIRAIVTIMPSVPQEVFDVTSSSPQLRHFHYMLDDHIEYGDKDRHNLSTLFSDSPHKNIFDVLEFMHDARMNGHAVMVHCEQGKRRSATVMAAYLIWFLNLSRKDSIQLIQSKRRGATIPGIWRDELQFLAEHRASLDEAMAANEKAFDRMISEPVFRLKMEDELKRKLRERRSHTQHMEDEQPQTPTSGNEADAPAWAQSPFSPERRSGGVARRRAENT